MESLEKPRKTVHDFEVLSRTILEQGDAICSRLDQLLCRKEALEQAIANHQEGTHAGDPPLTDDQARLMLKMIEARIEAMIEALDLEKHPALADEEEGEHANAHGAESPKPGTKLTPQMFKDKIRSFAHRVETEMEMIKRNQLELSNLKRKCAELKVKEGRLTKQLVRQEEKQLQQAKTRSKPTASDRWYKARKLRG